MVESSNSSDDQSNPSGAEGRDQAGTPIENSVRETQESVSNTTDAVGARRAQKLFELAERRETQDISPHDFDLNFLFQLNAAGLPLTRKDMMHETGGQVVVLTREDFELLGCLDFTHVSGERMLIEPESLDSNDVFILYPDEVGE